TAHHLHLHNKYRRQRLLFIRHWPTTVSGAIAGPRRPAEQDTPWEREPEDSDPAGRTQGDSGDNSASVRDEGATDAPSDGTTDKKVL
ncbi:hypothetical protein ACFV7N_28070, partial [Streptomyces tendae]